MTAAHFASKHAGGAAGLRMAPPWRTAFPASAPFLSCKLRRHVIRKPMTAFRTSALSVPVSYLSSRSACGSAELKPLFLVAPHRGHWFVRSVLPTGGFCQPQAEAPPPEDRRPKRQPRRGAAPAAPTGAASCALMSSISVFPLFAARFGCHHPVKGREGCHALVCLGRCGACCGGDSRR